MLQQWYGRGLIQHQRKLEKLSQGSVVMSWFVNSSLAILQNSQSLAFHFVSLKTGQTRAIKLHEPTTFTISFNHPRTLVMGQELSIPSILTIKIEVDKESCG